jgi:AraC-like DNA-binding protein
LILDQDLERLAVQVNYDARKLAILMSLSPRQLQRNFQRDIGNSPQTWLNEQKIIRAKQLLLAGGRVKSVASQLGYKHASYFCHQFKVATGVTPREFLLMASAVAKV